MISIPGYQIVDTINEGVKVTIFRAKRIEDGKPVVLKMTTDESPSLAELSLLRHEHELLLQVKGEGLPEVLALEKHENRLILVTSDIGGKPVKKCLQDNGVYDQEQFLKIAINAAAALGEIHQSQIIHKDINPSNLVVNDEGTLQIIDFGISTQLSKENPKIGSPDLLEGTLAYISPEQTGRMNRAIDYRTDFYSLGATFYEMLSGQVPFPASSPMEMVHSHIAKQPTPLHKIKSEIPEAISDIVMKLLSKTAEERYQGSFGLKADLEKCRDELAAKGKIESFPIAQQDISDQFQIPERLYGREDEIKTLMSAFDRVSEGTTEMMLVAGYSGTGKSALVNEIHKPIVRQKGYFLSGKCDQFQRNVPLSSLIQAFRDLTQQLLTEYEERIRKWKLKLLEALGENGQLIIDVIPEMELIIGRQNPVPELPATEAQNRFNLVFQKFVSVFADKEHPLVIFLDDLQWADSASLKLLKILMTDIESSYLFLIGAYRDNEVDSSHPLMDAIDELKGKEAIIHTISLENLTPKDVNNLVSDTLHCSPESGEALSKIVLEKTAGNAFFVNEFMKSLYHEDIVKFNLSLGKWEWNIDQLSEMETTDNVVDLMLGKIRKLGEMAQNMLMLASCIGNKFDLRTLSIVHETARKEALDHLWEAVEEGMILPIGDSYKQVSEGEENGDVVKVSFRFLHDRVQQAAYSLISEEQKAVTHLKIGRLLLSGLSEEKVEEKLFDLINHLNEGITLIEDTNEKEKLSQLNLKAAKKAKDSTAYQPALVYINHGISLLPKTAWEDDYEGTFSIYKERAEIAFLASSFEQAEEYMTELLEITKTDLDKADVYALKLLSAMLQGKLDESIKIGLKGLTFCGVDLPEEPGEEVGAEIGAAATNLGDRQVAHLLDSPKMSDPNHLMAMRFLMELCAPTYILGKANLFTLCVMRMVNLSLQYGNTEESEYAYSIYGLVLCGPLKQYGVGYEYGKLAIALNEKLYDLNMRCKVNNLYSAYILPWSEHVRKTHSYRATAIESGQVHGDLLYARYAAHWGIKYRFIQGDHLDDVESYFDKYYNFIAEGKDFDIITVIRSVALCGKAMQKGFDKAFNNKTVNEEEIQNIAMGHNVYHTMKGRALYHFDRYQEAFESTQEANKTLAGSMASLMLTERSFFDSLSAAALYPTASDEEKEKYMEIINANQEEMKDWATHNPYNFEHKYLLVEAEKARILGETEKAMDLYEEAIKSAKDQQYINNEALARELAAKFYLSRNFIKIAETYMVMALYGYEKWGAEAKAEQLRNDYPEITPLHGTAGGGLMHGTVMMHNTVTTAGSTTTSGGALDLLSVMEASQAISEEIVFKKLLEKVLTIVTENAGAQKSILILPDDDDQLVITAEYFVDENKMDVLGMTPVEESKSLSPAIVQYVSRIKKDVVIHNAILEDKYARDPYVVKNQPKSILCSPIINQGKLTGILYLENNLTQGAFTEQRLEVLGLISSQMAISIDNARLYNTLENKVLERTAAISDLLNNTGEGFLTFGSDFKVHKEYSKTCLSFFGQAIENMGILDLLFPSSEQQQTMTSAKEILDMVFQGIGSLGTMEDLLPKEVSVGERILKLEYRFIPACDSNPEDKIMLITSDITAEKALEEQLKSDEEYNATLLKIVTDRDGFIQFLRELDSLLAKIEKSVSGNPEDVNANELFRYFHTIKGGSASFGFKEVAEKAHEIESGLEPLREGEEKVTPELLTGIQDECQDLHKKLTATLERFKEVIPEEELKQKERSYRISNSHILQFRKTLLDKVGGEYLDQIEEAITELLKQPIGSVLRKYGSDAKKLAEKLSKEVVVELRGSSLEVSHDPLESLFSNLIHLVRNSIDHGLETPDVRSMLGKSEAGKLEIEAKKEDQNLILSIRDDGAGIDPDVIKNIALGKGIVEEEWANSASDSDLIKLIFAPGFSTKEEVSDVSGRGVGMDAVKAAIDDLGGDIHVYSVIDEGSTFTVIIPMKY